MSLNKTALKKMKKEELVEHILKIQKEQATSALLSSSDEETSTEETDVVMTSWLAAATFKLRNAEAEIKKLGEENERLKKHIIHNYQDLHPNGDGIPHTEYFPGGRYAIDEREEKRICDNIAKKYPDDERPEPRTPYSALCGQIGEGISDLQSKVDDLERNLCGSLSLCCDCCQSSITEDDVNMSIENRCGKLLCEECCDEQEEQTETPVKELEKKIEELQDTNDELEDYYCDREDKLSEENEKLKEDLLYNRMYLYVVDPDADCFPKKDDVDAWTDDPQERKTLYKRIYYESDGDDEDDEEEE